MIFVVFLFSDVTLRIQTIPRPRPVVGIERLSLWHHITQRQGQRSFSRPPLLPMLHGVYYLSTPAGKANRVLLTSSIWQSNPPKKKRTYSLSLSLVFWDAYKQKSSRGEGDWYPKWSQLSRRCNNNNNKRRARLKGSYSIPPRFPTFRFVFFFFFCFVFRLSDVNINQHAIGVSIYRLGYLRASKNSLRSQHTNLKNTAVTTLLDDTFFFFFFFLNFHFNWVTEKKKKNSHPTVKRICKQIAIVDSLCMLYILIVGLFNQLRLHSMAELFDPGKFKPFALHRFLSIAFTSLPHWKDSAKWKNNPRFFL